MDRRVTRTFVTVLSTDNYVDGVLALHASLLSVRSQHELLVVVGEAVSPRAKSLLDRAGLQTIDATYKAGLPDELLSKNSETGRAHWNFTFDKLFVFSLCSYEKIILLDSDMIVLRNIDHVFERDHLSAVAAGASWPGNEDWTALNSGLVVVIPQRDAFRRLVDLIPSTARRRRGASDQDVIHEAFPRWPDLPHLHLDETYNLLVPYLDFYMSRLGYRWTGETGVRVLHFIGLAKPWMLSGRQRLVRGLRLLVRGKVHQVIALMLHARMVRRGRALLRGKRMLDIETADSA